MNISTPSLSSLPSTSDLPDLRSVKLPTIQKPNLHLDQLPDTFESIVETVVDGASDAAGRTQRALRSAQRRPKAAGAVLAGLVLVVLGVLIVRRRRNSDATDRGEGGDTRVVRAA